MLFRSMALLGDVEIVEVERVLGVGVAAYVALAAIDARGLQRAVAVPVLVPDRQGLGMVVAEEDVDVGSPVRPAVLVGNRIEQLGPPHAPARIAVERNGPRAQHLLGDGVVGREPGAVVALRPALREGLLRRLEKDVGVDQRAAAQARAQHGVDVAAVADVEQAVLLALARDSAGPRAIRP